MTMAKHDIQNPPTPQRPLLVLARIKRLRIVRWMVSCRHVGGAVRFTVPGSHGWHAPAELKVVKHEQNDSEAVALIEAKTK